jgi:hypothetical protein
MTTTNWFHMPIIGVRIQALGDEVIASVETSTRACDSCRQDVGDQSGKQQGEMIRGITLEGSGKEKEVWAKDHRALLMCKHIESKFHFQ